MIGCLQTHVRKQSIIALYFEFEIVLKFHNLEAWSWTHYFQTYHFYRIVADRKHSSTYQTRKRKCEMPLNVSTQ